MNAGEAAKQCQTQTNFIIHFFLEKVSNYKELWRYFILTKSCTTFKQTHKQNEEKNETLIVMLTFHSTQIKSN